MTRCPNPITGHGPKVTWLNRLRAFFLGQTILPGVGYRIRRTAAGTVLELL